MRTESARVRCGPREDPMIDGLHRWRSVQTRTWHSLQSSGLENEEEVVFGRAYGGLRQDCKARSDQGDRSVWPGLPRGKKCASTNRQGKEKGGQRQGTGEGAAPNSDGDQSQEAVPPAHHVGNDGGRGRQRPQLLDGFPFSAHAPGSTMVGMGSDKATVTCKMSPDRQSDNHGYRRRSSG